jgi:hypothetical protein
MDADAPEEYFRLLDQLPLPERLNEAATQRARQYVSIVLQLVEGWS